jgi:hypothetical protein
MVGKFLAPLGVKIFGGLSLFLLITLGVLTWKISDVRNDLGRERDKHATTESERKRYQDALAFFVNDGQLRIGRGQAALKDHAGVSADLQRQANKIRTATITDEGCETPAEVMGSAGL